MKKICLTMIVKDEAHIIERCLDSVRGLVDFYWIVDTGSSDGTDSVIKNWFTKNNLKGEICYQKWVNFAHNRTEALRLARHTFEEADYLLMIDADEIIVFRDEDAVKNIKKLKENLTADLYDVQTLMSGSTYVRPQLTKASKQFKYKGVMHEFLDDSDDPIKTRGIVTDFVNKPIQDSARNKDPDKFKKDAEALEKALETENDHFMRTRYRFYLAQCLKDSGDIGGALKNYKKRASMGGWHEEVYWSHYQAAQMMIKLGSDAEEVIQRFLKAHEAAPYRAEALFGAAKHARENKLYNQAYMIAKQGIELKYPADSLFGEIWIYNFGIMDEYAVAAYYTNRPKESMKTCEAILKKKAYPPEEEKRIKKNLEFAREAWTK